MSICRKCQNYIITTYDYNGLTLLGSKCTLGVQTQIDKIVQECSHFTKTKKGEVQ